MQSDGLQALTPKSATLCTPTSTLSDHMWGIESQRNIVRERMKLLLAAHNSEIIPVEVHAEPGELLLRQGAPADRVMLLTEGTVAIQVSQAMEHLTPWRSWKLRKS